MSQLPNNMKNLFVIATVLSLCACGKSSNSSSSADTLANNSQNGALGSGSNHQLAQASQPFCIQKSIGLIALSSSSLNMSGGAHVAGDVILFDKDSSQISGNGKIDGTLYVPTGASLHASGNASYGSLSSQDLSVQATSISNVMSALASQPATQSFSSLTGSTVIQGNGGVNIINISGDIRLSGKSIVSLKGTADDTFVLNVRGNIALSGQSQLQVQGGTLVSKVIINNSGTGSNIAVSGQCHVDGTVFAPQRGFSISGGATLAGALIASGSINISGQGQVVDPQAFCSDDITPKPDPGPVNPPTDPVTPTNPVTPPTDPVTPTDPVVPPNLPPQCVVNPMVCA